MGQTKTRVFGRGSNVLEYWLAHAEEFEIRSANGRRERVESAALDAEAGRAEGLTVCSPILHRRREIPAEAFVAVDPFARELDLSDEYTRESVKVEDWAHAAAAAGQRATRTLAPLLAAA